ncbi:MAG: FHA domain-containing protein [Anaerolineales bacterium]|nr:FHA domain-containing protein [Anaerolineales bacterium]
MVRYIAESEEDFKTLQEPPAAAYLVLLVGGRPSHAFPLRGEIRLGRDKDNAVVVADQKVSRHHATLAPIDNTFILTDQGSANGTFLNGVQIAQPTRLKHHDRLTLGDTTFLFTIGQPDLTPPPEHPAPAPPVPPAATAFPPLAPPAAPAAPFLAEAHMPIWVLVGCMALVIIALLFVLALLLGLFMGSSQLLGWDINTFNSIGLV